MSDYAHRYRLARKRAGLTLGQAARLLNISTSDLSSIELLPGRATCMEPKLAELYQVRVEWLTGEVELRDYATIDGMKGSDGISFHDRDELAEFAASLPRGRTPEWVCSCGAKFLTMEALNDHAQAVGGLLHGDHSPRSS